MNGIACSAGPVQNASTVKLTNNTAVDPDGQLASTSWQFLLYNNENVIYKGSDWYLDDETKYPAGHATASHNQSSSILYFTGSEVAQGLLCSQTP